MKRGWVLCFAVVALGAVALCLAAIAQDKDADRKYLVRHTFWDGQKLRYSLAVSGNWQWAPEDDKLKSGKMSTEFIFTLSEKLIRQNGACTYALIGENLKSSGESAEGEFSVTADRDKCIWQINKLKGKGRDDNFLTKDMTITMDPRGRMPLSTGLHHVALFFLVHVDRNFWSPLTLAPREKVGVGDEWKADFNLQLPDSAGRPLKVDVKAKVTGWENFGRSKCLVGQLTAELELKDTIVTFKNGDRAHITTGKYRAQGKVMWDVERGLLCYASAQNSLVVTADKPTARKFAGQARCTLKLLAAE